MSDALVFAPPLVVVHAEIPTEKLYPLVDHKAGYDKGQDANYNTQLDRVCESIEKEGILNPVITHNRRDDGTYQVCIGCQRYFAADRLGLPSMKCIVNCLEGQNHIPDGDRLQNSDEVAEYFEAISQQSLCIEAVPNPEVLGLEQSGGKLAFDYGDGGTKGGFFCSSMPMEQPEPEPSEFSLDDIERGVGRIVDTRWGHNEFFGSHVRMVLDEGSSLGQGETISGCTLYMLDGDIMIEFAHPQDGKYDQIPVAVGEYIVILDGLRYSISCRHGADLLMMR